MTPSPAKPPEGDPIALSAVLGIGDGKDGVPDRGDSESIALMDAFEDVFPLENVLLATLPVALFRPWWWCSKDILPLENVLLATLLVALFRP